MPKRNAQPFLRTSLGTPVTTTPYIIRSAIRTHPPPHPDSKYFAHQTKNVALGASIPTILCTFVAHNALPTSRHKLSEHTCRRKTATNLHKDESTIQHLAHHVACPCLGHDSRKSNGTTQRHQLSQMSWTGHVPRKCSGASHCRTPQHIIYHVRRPLHANHQRIRQRPI